MITADEIRQIVSKSYRSPVSFCKIFLAEWFPAPMPWFHRGILAILLRRSDFLLDFGIESWPDGDCVWDEAGLRLIIQHFVWKPRPDDPHCAEIPVFSYENGKLTMLTTDLTLILMPRGFSKTTITNAAILMMIVFKDEDFILYTSETGPHAEMQLQNVKTKLAEQELLRLCFGNLVPNRQSPKKWRDDYIETENGVTVAARGRGGQIRGLLRDGRRPGFIVADDLEDEESIKTPEQRQKALKWFMSTLRPALRQMGKTKGRLVMLATVLHADALSMNLYRDPSFISIVFSVEDRNGNPLWATMLSAEDIEKKRKSYQLLGQLSSFYLEYYNAVRVDETALFTQENFRYMFMARTEFTAVALACDPAISDDSKADSCTFGVVGITAKGLLSVLDTYGEIGMHPGAQIDKFFELNNIWRPTLHGVEAVAYQKALASMISSSQHEKAKQYGSSAYFAVQPITHRIAKVPRIKGILAPRYRAGYIVHQRRFPELEQQLLDFPGRKDDYPDVVAMAIKLLDPYAGLASDEELVAKHDEMVLTFEDEYGEFRWAP
jgi:hypothetical protein